MAEATNVDVTMELNIPFHYTVTSHILDSALEFLEISFAYTFIKRMNYVLDIESIFLFGQIAATNHRVRGSLL